MKKMRPMEPILAYTSLLALCYLVTLVKAENSENVTAPSSSRSTAVQPALDTSHTECKVWNGSPPWGETP